MRNLKQQKKLKICPTCEKEVLPDDVKFWLGLDRPYLNILFHRSCYLAIRGYLKEFLTENIEKILQIYNENA